MTIRSHPDPAVISRREALGSVAALGAAALAAPVLAQGAGAGAHADPIHTAGWDSAKGEYILPPLPYAVGALEPHIDAQTMTIHHDKHHAAYVRGANKALAELAKIRAGEGDASLVKHWSRELAFHGSGHVNHTLLWMTMAAPGAGGGGKPTGELASQIDRDFGSFDAFAAQFKGASNAVEGSGWGWLCWEPASARLVVLTGEKQQNGTIWGSTPILGVDVWEHAYYLKHQNNRAAYVDAFMNVINWPAVADFLSHARA
jgi:Fe-Mn family superoxide dismutase